MQAEAEAGTDVLADRDETSWSSIAASVGTLLFSIPALGASSALLLYRHAALRVFPLSSCCNAVSLPLFACPTLLSYGVQMLSARAYMSGLCINPCLTPCMCCGRSG